MNPRASAAAASSRSAGAGVAAALAADDARGPPGSGPDQGHESTDALVEPLRAGLRRVVRQVHQGVGRQDRRQGPGGPHPAPRAARPLRGRVRGRLRARPDLLRRPDPHRPVLSQPRRSLGRRRRARQEVRRLARDLQERGAGRRRLVRDPRLLHLDPGAVAQGPLRLGRASASPKTWDDLRKAARHAQGQGPSDGHAVLALQRRQPQLARPDVLLRRQGDRSHRARTS